MYGAGYPAGGYAAPVYGAPGYVAPAAYGAPGYCAPAAYSGVMPAGCMAYNPGMMIPPGYKLSKKGYLKPIKYGKVHKHHY